MRQLELKMLILMFAIFAISSFISLLCRDDEFVRRDSENAGLTATITMNTSGPYKAAAASTITCCFENVNKLTES
jgi:hypothetical protein